MIITFILEHKIKHNFYEILSGQFVKSSFKKTNKQKKRLFHHAFTLIAICRAGFGRMCFCKRERKC